MNMLADLFNDGPFMPHGHCYFWSESLIALHVISDALIVLAYFSIPITLVYFVNRRRNIEFNWMFVCFAVFILACGTTHLMEIWNIWHSNYWLSGGIKAITALASVPTAILLVKLVPQALSFASPAQLAGANRALQAEIVERKKTELKFKGLLESAPDAIVIVDREGSIVLVNSQTEKLFGYARAELLGQKIEALVADEFRGKYPGHRDEFFTDHKARPMGAGLELRGRRRDGTEFPVEICLSPLETEEGTLAISAIRDMTERKRGEQAIRENEERMRSIIETANDAFISIDAEGHVRDWNRKAETTFGWDRSSILGQSLVETIIPPHHREAHTRGLARFLASCEGPASNKQLELTAFRRNGQEFPVEITIWPLRIGDKLTFNAFVRDIIERKRAEQQILESLREKEMLLSEIHHRVKNNLAVISSLFYLQSTYTTDKRMIEILQESQDRVRSMSLVHECLYGARNFAAVDFAEYARSLSSQLIHTYSLNPGQVRLTTDLESVQMGIDLAVPCGLILNELVSNVLKHAFGTSEGEIRIRLHRIEAGQCVLAVTDNGAGLPPNFDLDSTPTLGLRLIRSLTRQIGGEFELLPAHPGTDASLTLSIDSHGKQN